MLVKGPWMVDMVPDQLFLMLPTELALSDLGWNIMFLLPAFSNPVSGHILQHVLVHIWWDLDAGSRMALPGISQ